MGQKRPKAILRPAKPGLRLSRAATPPRPIFARQGAAPLGGQGSQPVIAGGGGNGDAAAIVFQRLKADADGSLR